MKYYLLSLFLTIFSLLLCEGCGPKQVKAPLDDGDEYELALQKLEGEDYLEAREGFERLQYNHPGSELCDDAQFQVAESYFLDEDYIMASFEYSKLIKQYLSSPFREMAQYRLGMCYYGLMNPYTLDQEDTYLAIEEFNIYLFTHPGGTRLEEVREKLAECRNVLARKEYETGKFYMKRSRPESARIYFEEVVSQYGDTDWYFPALVELGNSFYREKRYIEADSIFTALPLDELPPGLAEEVEERRHSIRDRMRHN